VFAIKVLAVAKLLLRTAKKTYNKSVYQQHDSLVFQLATARRRSSKRQINRAHAPIFSPEYIPSSGYEAI